MPELSERQRQLYEVIVQSIENKGCQPSFRELAAQFGVGLNAIVNRLQTLQRKGLIQLSGKSRALRLPGLRFLRQDQSAVVSNTG